MPRSLVSGSLMPDLHYDPVPAPPAPPAPKKPRAAPDDAGGLTASGLVEAVKAALADPKTGFVILEGHLPNKGGTVEARLAPARNAPPGLE